MPVHEFVLMRHLTANPRGHTRGLARKIAELRRELAWLWIGAGKPRPPAGTAVKVLLIRCAPRRLDSRDNLRQAFKPVVDELVLCLGMRDDSDRNTDLRVEYAQESGRGVTSQAIVRVEWEDPCLPKV
jgi:hypothetical protein